MRRLAKIEGADLPQLWSITNKIRDQREYFYALAQIARSDRSRIPQILDLISSTDWPLAADILLVEILKIDSSYEPRIIEFAAKIEEPDRRSSIFIALAGINYNDYYPGAIKNIDLVEDIWSRINHLLSLLSLGLEAESDSSENKEEELEALVAKILETARSQEDRSIQVSILCRLAALDSAYIAEAWELSISLLQLGVDEDRAGWSLDKLAKLDYSYWPKALEKARSLPKFSRSYANALASLAAIDSTCLTEAIEALTTADENLYWVDDIFQQLFSSYSPQRIQTSLNTHQYQLLLDWAKSRRHPVIQAHTLITLAEFDLNCFPEALAKVRALPLENRAGALAKLANINPDYYSEAWDAVTQLAIAAKAESSDSSTHRHAYTSALMELASAIPEEMFPRLEEAIATIPDSAERARVLVRYIPRIAPEHFFHEKLSSYLRDLASGQRAFLTHNLANLAPAIVHLGGEETLRKVVDEMEDIRRQWP